MIETMKTFMKRLLPLAACGLLLFTILGPLFPYNAYAAVSESEAMESAKTKMLYQALIACLEQSNATPRINVASSGNMAYATVIMKPDAEFGNYLNAPSFGDSGYTTFRIEGYSMVARWLNRGNDVTSGNMFCNHSTTASSASANLTRVLLTRLGITTTATRVKFLTDAGFKAANSENNYSDPLPDDIDRYICVNPDRWTGYCSDDDASEILRKAFANKIGNVSYTPLEKFMLMRDALTTACSVNLSSMTTGDKTGGDQQQIYYVDSSGALQTDGWIRFPNGPTARTFNDTGPRGLFGRGDQPGSAYGNTWFFSNETSCEATLEKYNRTLEAAKGDLFAGQKQAAQEAAEPIFMSQCRAYLSGLESDELNLLMANNSVDNIDALTQKYWTQSKAGTNNPCKQIYEDAIAGKLDEIQTPDEPEEAAEAQYSCYNPKDESFVVKAISWFLCPIIDFIAEQVDNLNERVNGLLRIDAQLLNYENGTYEAWNAFRNIANFCFIVLLLIVIFSQLTGFGINNYGVKKLLPNLIVGAVLVNLSFIICQLAVDVSNIVGNSAGDLMTGIAENINVDAGGVVSFRQITAGLLTGATLGIGAAAAIGTAVVTLFTGGGWIPLLMALIPVVIAIIMFFVLLGARQLIVITFVAIAPLAFVAYIFPNTKSLFKKWYSVFQAALVVFPVCAFLAGAGKVIQAIVLRNLEEGSGANVLMGALTLAAPFIPFLVAPALTRKSISAIGAAGASLAGIGKTLGGAAQKGLDARQKSPEYQAKTEGNMAKNAKWRDDLKRNAATRRKLRKDGGLLHAMRTRSKSDEFQEVREGLSGDEIYRSERSKVKAGLSGQLIQKAAADRLARDVAMQETANPNHMDMATPDMVKGHLSKAYQSYAGLLGDDGKVVKGNEKIAEDMRRQIAAYSHRAAGYLANDGVEAISEVGRGFGADNKGRALGKLFGENIANDAEFQKTMFSVEAPMAMAAMEAAAGGGTGSLADAEYERGKKFDPSRFMLQNGEFRKAYLSRLRQEDPDAALAFVMSILDTEDPATRAKLDKPGALSSLGVNDMLGGLSLLNGRPVSTGVELRNVLQSRYGTEKLSQVDRGGYGPENMSMQQYAGIKIHGSREGLQQFESSYADKARMSPGAAALSPTQLRQKLNEVGGVNEVLSQDAIGKAVAQDMFESFKSDKREQASMKFVVDGTAKLLEESGQAIPQGANAKDAVLQAVLDAPISISSGRP
jgi:hypothetical protein